jgi:RNA polymerase sigma-70 factor (ECF subfamily)
VRQASLLAQCEGFTHKHIAKQMGLSLRSMERYVADPLYLFYVLRYEP